MAAAGRHPRADAGPARAARSARASRRSSSTRRPRSFIRSQGADAGLQGLPRLPGLDLRVAELDGRARHPGPLQAPARRHPLRRRRRHPRRLGRRRGAHVPGRRDLARSPRKLLEVTRGVAVRGRRAVPRRQPPRRRLPRRPGARRGRRASRSCARSSATASAATMHEEPQIPNYGTPGKGVAARGGHGARRRADGHRRPPRGPDGRRRLGDLLPGRLAGRALRVHDRDHGRRAADPHAVARDRAAAARPDVAQRGARTAHVLAIHPSVALWRAAARPCASFASSARGSGGRNGRQSHVARITPERDHEGTTVGQADVREVQDHPPPRRGSS